MCAKSLRRYIKRRERSTLGAKQLGIGKMAEMEKAEGSSRAHQIACLQNDIHDLYAMYDKIMALQGSIFDSFLDLMLKH